MITLIASTKGGAGKSTIALQLALSRGIVGHDVWLVDADPQGTCQKAITQRSLSNQWPMLACDHYTTGDTLRAQVRQQAHKHEDVIVDVGGYDSTLFRTAMMLADFMVIPFQPRGFDLWEMQHISELIGEAKDYGARLQAFAFINMADPDNIAGDNREAAAMLREADQVEYLPTSIGRRKAFPNASCQGLSVLELKRQDERACEEIRALDEILYGHQHGRHRVAG